MRQKLAGLPAAGLAVLVSILLGSPAPARAHLAAGSRSLSQLVAGAELVVHARILESDSAAGSVDPTLGRPLVTAQVIATLKGVASEGPLRFAQHGHGTASFAPGDETLLFLGPLASSPELAGSRLAGRVAWVSLQEHGEGYRLGPSNRGARLAAAKGYADLEGLASAADRGAARKRLLLAGLASTDTRLAAGALRDLAGAGPAALPLDAVDTAKLDAMVADPARPAGLRAGILSQLEARGLADAPTRWVALVRSSPPDERAQALRAAGAHPSPAVTTELVKHLGTSQTEVAAAAAAALGRPAHAAAAPDLAALLESPEPRLRNAAIRGLAGMASEPARAALARAAAEHPDPDTRRRARAAAARLAGQAG